jgi:hypothetical protein
VAGSADLEEDSVLALQGYLAIVQAPRRLHNAKGIDELIGLQADPFLGDGMPDGA